MDKQSRTATQPFLLASPVIFIAVEACLIQQTTIKLPSLMDSRHVHAQNSNSISRCSYHARQLKSVVLKVTLTFFLQCTGYSIDIPIQQWVVLALILSCGVLGLGCSTLPDAVVDGEEREDGSPLFKFASWPWQWG